MPLVSRVEETEGITDPAAYQVRTGHGHIEDMAAAPVVADQIHRLPEGFEPGDQPVTVTGHGRLETAGQGRSEARRRQAHDIVTAELAQQRTPHSRRLRIAVHEQRWPM
jgi:hypothetical protein